MAAKNLDLNDIHDTLISLAYKAGETITSALPATNDTGSKKNSQWSQGGIQQQMGTNALVPW